MKFFFVFLLGQSPPGQPRIPVLFDTGIGDDIDVPVIRERSSYCLISSWKSETHQDFPILHDPLAVAVAARLDLIKTFAGRVSVMDGVARFGGRAGPDADRKPGGSRRFPRTV